MKRLGIFAHFDAEDEVKRYVLHHLDALRPLCDRLLFYSTSSLDADQRARAAARCYEVTLTENVGFDFGMWKRGLSTSDLAAYDEVVLVNSSVFGPLWPLGPYFERMAHHPCWGMTDNFDHGWHVQSYFLVFGRRVLESEAFRSFWRDMEPQEDKHEVIKRYEVGLTHALERGGHRPGVVTPTESLFPTGRLRELFLYRQSNATCTYPDRLVAAGMPFVKVEALRNNPYCIRLGPLRRAMRRAGYDERLIEFDRPSPGTTIECNPYFTWAQRPITDLLTRLGLIDRLER